MSLNNESRLSPSIFLYLFRNLPATRSQHDINESQLKARKIFSKRESFIRKQKDRPRWENTVRRAGFETKSCPLVVENFLKTWGE